MNRKILLIVLLIIYNICFGQKTVISKRNFFVLNEKDGTYTIKHRKKKIELTKLKFVQGIGTDLQILTSNNQIKFLDKNLSIITKPKEETFYYCGTVENFRYKISETKTHFEVIQQSFGYKDFNDRNIIEEKHLFKINKEGIINIYFYNNNKSLEFDENFYEPPMVFIDYNTSKKGIALFNKLSIFDKIEIANNLKVEKDGKFGYYGKTKCIFDSLGDFNYNLAAFKKGTVTGYIDKKGNEYIIE